MLTYQQMVADPPERWFLEAACGVRENTFQLFHSALHQNKSWGYTQRVPDQH